MGAISPTSPAGGPGIFSGLDSSQLESAQNLCYNVAIAPAKNATDADIKKFNEPSDDDDDEPKGGM